MSALRWTRGLAAVVIDAAAPYVEGAGATSGLQKAGLTSPNSYPSDYQAAQAGAPAVE